MATIEILHRGATGERHGSRLTDVFSGVLGAFLRARQSWRAGAYLVQMDDHMLKDIGISRAQAAFMASRPLLGSRSPRNG